MGELALSLRVVLATPVFAPAGAKRKIITCSHRRPGRELNFIWRFCPRTLVLARDLPNSKNQRKEMCRPNHAHQK